MPIMPSQSFIYYRKFLMLKEESTVFTSVLILLPPFSTLVPTSVPMKREEPRLKAFSLPSSRTSMCCIIPSATFHVTVK